jgi:two-component system KDP operon response regulator KdpE
MVIERKPMQHLDVLIVEDDDMLNRVMSLQLTTAGLSVRSSRSGEQALAMIKERMPSALILDLGLPDMTGKEVIEQLRSEPATCALPVIVHTTLDLSLAQQAQLKLGPTRCVTKTTAYSDALAELVLELVHWDKSGT